MDTDQNFPGDPVLSFSRDILQLLETNLPHTHSRERFEAGAFTSYIEA